MRKLFNVLTSLILSLSIILIPVTSYANITLGNRSLWAENIINKSINYNLLPNIYDSVDLKEPVTRLDFAHLSVKAYEVLTGKPAPYISQNNFTDTRDKIINSAYNLGLINGIGDGLFAPNDTLTREQAATITARLYLKVNALSLTSNGVNRFKDDNDISDYAKTAVYSMTKKGYIEGVGNNIFLPQSDITKEQAIAITIRMIDSIHSYNKGIDILKYIQNANSVNEAYIILSKAKDTMVEDFKIKIPKPIYDDFIKTPLKVYLRGIENVAVSYNTKTMIANFHITYNKYAKMVTYLNGTLNEPGENLLQLNNMMDEIISKNIKDNMTPLQKEKAIHDYMVKTYDYDYNLYATIKENRHDVNTTFEGLLINKKGVCSAYTELFDLFMIKLNIPSLIVGGTIKGESHIWNMVYVDPKWRMVDVTWDDPLSSPSNTVSHTFFNLSTEQLLRTHTFIEEDYPNARDNCI